MTRRGGSKARRGLRGTAPVSRRFVPVSRATGSKGGVLQFPVCRCCRTNFTHLFLFPVVNRLLPESPTPVRSRRGRRERPPYFLAKMALGTCPVLPDPLHPPGVAPVLKRPCGKAEEEAPEPA